MNTNMKRVLIRITTVPISLAKLLQGQLRFMKEQGYDVFAVSSSGKEQNIVREQECVRLVSIDMSREISPLADIVSLVRMCVFLVREKPLIVHTHTPKAGLIGMLASWICRVPIRLHTVAGMPLLVHRGFKRRLLETVERLTYSCASRVYPNSFKMLDIILDLRLAEPEKVKVIANGSSNGIDTSYFNPSLFTREECEKRRADLGISLTDFVFIFVGRLVGDKGINELVWAFQRLEGMSHTKLLFVGDYEDTLDPLKLETIDVIRSNPNIIEVGWQNDVRPFLAISDALVFPSYREGFPNVVMQAGAMGLPSIVTNINGCNEIIEEGVNGIIVPPKDGDALLDAMRMMLGDTSLRKSMVGQARSMIVSRYEQSIVWQALLEEYRTLQEQYK